MFFPPSSSSRHPSSYLLFLPFFVWFPPLFLLLLFLLVSVLLLLHLHLLVSALHLITYLALIVISPLLCIAFSLLVVSPRFSTSFHTLGRFSPFIVIAVFVLPSLRCPRSSSSSTLLLGSTHRRWAIAIAGFASPRCPVIVVPVITLVAAVAVVSLLSLWGDCPSLSSIRHCRWVSVVGLAFHLLWFPTVLRRWVHLAELVNSSSSSLSRNGVVVGHPSFCVRSVLSGWGLRL